MTKNLYQEERLNDTHVVAEHLSCLSRLSVVRQNQQRQKQPFSEGHHQEKISSLG